jgi:hypothetical protein
MSLQRPPIPQAPLVDEHGYVTREWWRWFQLVGTVVGASSSITDITAVTTQFDLPAPFDVVQPDGPRGWMLQPPLELLPDDLVRLGLELKSDLAPIDAEQATERALELWTPPDTIDLRLDQASQAALLLRPSLGEALSLDQVAQAALLLQPTILEAPSLDQAAAAAQLLHWSFGDALAADQLAMLAAMLAPPPDPLRAGNGISIVASTVSLSTPVSAANGGTGVNNGSNTLTLSGGAYTLAGITTARTITFPDASDTVDMLGQAQTISGNKSFNSGTLILKGATSGTLTVKPAAVAGANTLTLPAGTTDFSATGGSNQVVQQTSAGGAFTVGQLGFSNLSGSYASAQSSPANQNTTSVGTFVMAGFAATITPTISGKVLMVISGIMSNGTINDGASIAIRYGTGTAPVNGAALTGTGSGSNNPSITSYTAGQGYPFTCIARVTGLTLNTAYWVDGIIQALTGGTATFANIGITLLELP